MNGMKENKRHEERGALTGAKMATFRESVSGDPEIDALIHRVVGAAYTVSNTLGVGFLEKVYEEAMAIELAEIGIAYERQPLLTVIYKEQCVGSFRADMVIESKLLLELKAVNVPTLAPFAAQCLNYLKASEMLYGLILNFGKPKCEWQFCRSARKTVHAPLPAPKLAKMTDPLSTEAHRSVVGRVTSDTLRPD